MSSESSESPLPPSSPAPAAAGAAPHAASTCSQYVMALSFSADASCAHKPRRQRGRRETGRHAGRLVGGGSSRAADACPVGSRAADGRAVFLGTSAALLTVNREQIAAPSYSPSYCRTSGRRTCVCGGEGTEMALEISA
jgi:hypothetical protein